MHILLIGGSGFIGSHCAKKLISSGHSVSIVDDFSFPPYGAKRVGLEKEELKYRARELLSEAKIYRTTIRKLKADMFVDLTRPPDTIVHFAGLSVVSHAQNNPDLARDSILDDTRRIAEWAMLLPNVRRVVFVSSSMVYGNFSHDPMPEWGQTKPLGLYGQLKLEAERLFRAALHGTGMEAVIVRPSAVYGPGEVSRRVVYTFCSRALAGERLQINSSADQEIDFSYVEDVAAGICLAAIHPAAESETFNLTYGEGRTLDELATLIAHHAGPVQIERVGHGGTPRGRRGALDISKAQRLLGYCPSIDLDTGLALYYRHLACQRDTAMMAQSL